jgi:hypothetical protein
MKVIWSALVMGSLMGAAGCVGMDELASDQDQGLKNTGATTVIYTGQGAIADGFGGYDLQTELCGVVNGADVDGAYLLWVFTATGAKSATITGPWGTADMTASGGGTFKYISAWYDPDGLPGNVSATITSGSAKNAQLVISHGCRPFNPEKPAWCSPGFWKNAEAGAWAVTGHTPSDLFNSTVVPGFYANPFGANPTLFTTLNDVAYKSGQLTDAPFNLTPFNATGAFLTEEIPGYTFSTTDYAAGSDTCPLDHHGNWKEGAGPQ